MIVNVNIKENKSGVENHLYISNFLDSLVQSFSFTFLYEIKSGQSIPAISARKFMAIVSNDKYCAWVEGHNNLAFSRRQFVMGMVLWLRIFDAMF